MAVDDLTRQGIPCRNVGEIMSFKRKDFKYPIRLNIGKQATGLDA